ncbi:MAG TPA: MauE/DoxX family redox-associated membrane protein, partial [Opitutaceae bacterium]|nr:MauE/DoxX family redox-associated membrane protein [Opitutaceae bacterium]
MPRIVMRWVLAAFFVLAGLNHFRSPGVYAGMMPAWLPWPAALVGVSGACEVLGGVGILVPRTRRAAGWGLVALLAAVLPANVHVALLGRMPGFG